MIDPDVSASVTATFEGERLRLRRLAYHMLGSAAEAEDVVQDAWLRFHGHQTGVAILDPAAWLTTVTSRLALDVLRRRKRRGEEPVADAADDRATAEQAMMMADAVGMALRVVLDRLSPVERVAFVLHDAFGMPFDAIALILQRSSDAARQAASRARRRVRLATMDAAARPDRDLVRAFAAAAQAGDIAAIIRLLAPDVVLHIDVPGDAPRMVRGAAGVANGARMGAAGAAATLGWVAGRPALMLDGGARVMLFEMAHGCIARIEMVAGGD
jgi:RNA polymerase sigma factor (sigma-70 family)